MCSNQGPLLQGDLRQCLVIHLAGAAKRQFGQDTDSRGNHVVGQTHPQDTLQRIRPDAAAGRHPGVNHGATVALDQFGSGLCHALDGEQGGLDLPEFDPVAAQLDLAIQPPHKMQLPLRIDPAAVASAVHPAAGPERIGQKYLRVELWPVQVTTRQRAAANVDLARHADRLQLQILAEHINAGVVDRPADGQGRRHHFAVTFPGRGKDAGFRWPIHIEQARTGHFDITARQLGREHFAAATGNPQTQARALFRQVQKASQRGRHKSHDRHCMADRKLRHHVRQQAPGRCHSNTRAVHQRKAQLDQRRVERGLCRQCRTVLLPHLVRSGQPRQAARQRGMLHQNAFWAARRA